MKLEQLIKSSLDNWTDDVRVPLDLPSRAIRRGRRQRSVRTMTAVSAAVVVAVGVAFAVPDVVGHSPRPAATSAHRPQAKAHTTTTVSAPMPPSTPWQPLPLTHAHTGNTTISAHPDEAPPVHFVAADDVALSAYAINTTPRTSVNTWSWRLYSATTGTYVQVPWAWLDVAPGLGIAAVLEGPAATRRIGIISMATGSLIRWIPTAKPVGTVMFSPDGKTLAATTYQGDPRRSGADSRAGAITGFILINLTNGDQTVVSSAVGYQGWSYTGLRWTYNGHYLYVPSADDTHVWFYAPDGQAVAAPPHADLLTENNGTSANVSPDGDRALAINGGGGSKPQTAVVNMATGRVIGTQPVEELDAWANNDALVGWGCTASCKNEFNSQLVVVSVNGKTITPLSAFTGGSHDTGGWMSLWTRR